MADHDSVILSVDSQDTGITTIDLPDFENISGNEGRSVRERSASRALHINTAQEAITADLPDILSLPNRLENMQDEMTPEYSEYEAREQRARQFRPRHVQMMALGIVGCVAG